MRTKKRSIALLILMIIPSLKAQYPEVCHVGFGCFSLGPPFEQSGTLPESIEDTGFKLRIYRPYGPQPVHVPFNECGQTNPEFNVTLPLHVLIHGFQGSEYDRWLTEVRDALMSKHKCNVIIVGWQKGARPRSDFMLGYKQAAANTRIVARALKVYLVWHAVQHCLNLQNVHVIGHGLGAQIAGIAGAEVYEELSRRIGRISGLDPAGLFFGGPPSSARLDQSDAVFVDVIHTDGNCYGHNDTAGNVDFYPNGGKEQPGCPKQVCALSTANVPSGDYFSCPHSRAHKLYLESITTSDCQFKAYPCPGEWNDFKAGKCSSCGTEGGGCSEMGFNSYHSAARGKFYLKTSEGPTFCMKQA